MTTYYCKKFESTLNTIHNKGITTKSALMKNADLCAELWLATKDYIDHYVLLSKTSKNSKGETTVGNSAKIAELSKHAVCDREDIENDCLIKIMDKLDLILAKPIAVQQYYSYKIINNVVNQACRDFLPPDNYIIVSLQDTIGYSSDDEEDFTYESIATDNVTPESKIDEEDSVRCLEDFYYSNLIAQKPAQAFAHLSGACGMKNSTVKNMLLEKGKDFTFNYVINKSNYELFGYLNEAEYEKLKVVFSLITDENLKLNTNDPDTIGDQISKLRNRAKNEIKKAYRRAKL